MGNRKKILFIAPSPIYLEKGSSLRMFEVAKTLSKKYFVDIVTYSIGEKFKIKNTKIWRTPSFFKPDIPVGKPSISKILLDLFLLKKCINLITKNKYDIIHCEDFEGAAIGYSLSLFNKKYKLVYDLHNKLTDNLKIVNKSYLNFLIAPMERLITKKFDLVILNWNKYFNDPLFNHKSRFLYYDKINLALKKYPSFKFKYIIYTGNFENYQGIKEFLNIFKDLKSQIKLVLVGKPTNEIKNFIASNSLLRDRVILTGRLPISQTNFLIKNSLFGILPRIEGSSMKLIHYIMFNKSVLARKTNSNRELLKDGFNSLLYSTEEELKQKLMFLIKNSLIMKKGVNKTKNYILKIWEEENFLRNYEKSSNNNR